MKAPTQKTVYRGRIAPSPTGGLHPGHAQTFSIAAQRARANNGILILRNEDLDPQRSKPEFFNIIVQDLAALNIDWQEGPFHQSQRMPLYLQAWEFLKDNNLIYPCNRSRKDIAAATLAPHEDDDEPIFPAEFRPTLINNKNFPSPDGYNWRFRASDGEIISFVDNNLGNHSFVAGEDFGDFIIWRKDNVPAYELAVVVDDHDMAITEVVRGRDLLKSTARQILLYRALGWPIPQFYHCPLVLDENGKKLSKREGHTLLTLTHSTV